MDATGTGGFRPFVLGLLAEAQLLAGALARAGDTLRLATQEADRLGEHLYDPQLRALLDTDAPRRSPWLSRKRPPGQ
jgi:hypothetical protein